MSFDPNELWFVRARSEGGCPDLWSQLQPNDVEHYKEQWEANPGNIELRRMYLHPLPGTAGCPQLALAASLAGSVLSDLLENAQSVASPLAEEAEMALSLIDEALDGATFYDEEQRAWCDSYRQATGFEPQMTGFAAGHESFPTAAHKALDWYEDHANAIFNRVAKDRTPQPAAGTSATAPRRRRARAIRGTVTRQEFEDALLVDPGLGEDVLPALYAVYIEGRRISDTAELWGVQYQKIYSAAKRFEIALGHARRIKEEDLTRGLSY